MTRAAARLAPLILVAAALAAPPATSAWQTTFGKYFQLSGVSGQAQKLVLQKCHGGKLGNWKLTAKHYILIQDQSSDLFVQLEMQVKFPVTTEFQKLKVKKFELDYSDSFPDDAANEIHDSLVHFFNGSFAKVNSSVTQMTFRQNGLDLGGEEVIEPGETTAPFNPKPGC